MLKSQGLMMNTITRMALLTLVWLLGAVSTAQAGPKIEHWTTDNGLRVYFVAAPQLPMLDIRLTFAAGGARDAGNPGWRC
ncbi:MAG: hypothetical protein R3E95_01510 [Thiolinea sp.]